MLVQTNRQNQACESLLSLPLLLIKGCLELVHFLSLDLHLLGTLSVSTLHLLLQQSNLDIGLT